MDKGRHRLHVEASKRAMARRREQGGGRAGRAASKASTAALFASVWISFRYPS